MAITTDTLTATSKVVINAAASADDEALRKGEFDAAVDPLIAASHAKATGGSTNTISVAVDASTQAVTANARLKSGGYLASDTNGLYVDVASLAPAVKASIAAATTSAAGLMSATDKVKLDGLTQLTLGAGSGNAAAGNHSHSNATTSAAGFMSAQDKIDLAAAKAAIDGATVLSAADARAAIGAAIVQTASVTPIYAASQFTWNVRLTPNYGLHQGPSGVQLDFGTGALQAAPGNHAHSDYESRLAALEAIDHAAATGDATNSATVSVDGSQVITANVRLKTDGALAVDSDGVYADVGTGSTQVAAGNHTHSDYESRLAALEAVDHAILTKGDTNSISLSLAGAGGQTLTANARLKTNGGLAVDVDGIYADVGTGATQVAAGNHTHSAYESRLAALEAVDHAAASGANTNSITLTVNPSTQAISADLRLKSLGGLAIGADGVYMTLTGYAQTWAQNQTFEGRLMPGSAGLRFGSAPTEEMSFFGVTPVNQPSDSGQASFSPTLVAGDVAALSFSTTPTQAELNAFKAVAQKIETDLLKAAGLSLALRAAGVELGLIKGSA